MLRFLNLRYPRDYNTVPRLYFWLFHLLWLFPWSVYFPAVAKLSFRPLDRAGRTRLLALCWTGFLLVFFTFSTTQEYYSMPCYPALALLLGSAMAAGGDWVGAARGCSAVFCGCAAVAAVSIVVSRAQRSRAGRHFGALVAASRRLHAVARPHGRPDDPVVRLSAPAAVWSPRSPFSSARWERLRTAGQRAFLAAALMMVLFLPRRPAGAGGFRPLSVLAPSGRGAAAVARKGS